MIPRFPKYKKSPIFEEETVHNERWLLTYSDMITLLLGLFIILYAISKVDQTKLQSVASNIRKGFGVKDPAQVVLVEGGTGILEDDLFQTKSSIFRLWERLGYAFQSLKDKAKIKLGLAETEELKLTFFVSGLDSGSGLDKDPDVRFAFTQLAELSKEMDLEFIIQVHIPYEQNLDQSKFQNSWDFHAHKASLFAEALAERYGIPKEKIAVQGYSIFQKSAQADTPEKRAKEERLEILVKKRQSTPP